MYDIQNNKNTTAAREADETILSNCNKSTTATQQNRG
jgi:hypothetical protein